MSYTPEKKKVPLTSCQKNLHASQLEAAMAKPRSAYSLTPRLRTAASTSTSSPCSHLRVPKSRCNIGHIIGRVNDIGEAQTRVQDEY